MELKVLDHGSVILRNVSGPTRRTNSIFDASDVDPANSARMSFNQMDRGRKVEADLKLCDYLMKHSHTTPFEMIEVWLELKLPIFVFRQFDRHRTAIKSTCSMNEISGRYVKLPEEWYVPKVVGGKAASKKQGQEDNLEEFTQHWFQGRLEALCVESYKRYSEAIDKGVAPEHARLMLHTNHYTRVLWKQDLHNLMHFIALRSDGHAQIEAQEYAEAVYNLLREALPNCMDLFDKYRRLNTPSEAEIELNALKNSWFFNLFSMWEKYVK